METNHNKLHGIYDTEEALKAEMDRLREQGYGDEDMYIVSNRNDRLSMYRGSAEYHEEQQEGSWWDRLKAFMMGEDIVRDQQFDQMGISHEDRNRYYEELRTGKFLLYVDRDYGHYFDERTTHDSSLDHVDDLHRHTTDTTVDDANRNPDEPRKFDNALDKTKPIGYDPNDVVDNKNLHDTKPLDERFDNDNRTYESKPVGYDNGATVQSNDYEDKTEEERLALHEERLEVDKNRVQTGEVHVDKHVVEENQTLEVPVEREEVYVERRSVNEGDNVNDTAQDGVSHAYEEQGEIHIPVTEEQVEVTKKDVVSEEIVVGKRKVTDTEKISETVRREEADITDTTRDGDDTIEHSTDVNDSFNNKNRGL